jgi:hypothetical protein
MVFLFGLRTTNLRPQFPPIFLGLFFIMISCATWASVLPPSLSLKEEQGYWSAWSKRATNSPLQPFVTGYTKSAAEEVDQLIQEAGSGEIQVLFMRVNLDNGLADVHYLVWSTSSEGISIKGSLLSGTGHHKAPFTDKKLVSQLIKLGKAGDGYEVSSKTMDADTMYLTIRTTDKTVRFASYDPAIPTTLEAPSIAQFVEYVQKRAKWNQDSQEK